MQLNLTKLKLLENHATESTKNHSQLSPTMLLQQDINRTCMYPLIGTNFKLKATVNTWLIPIKLTAIDTYITSSWSYKEIWHRSLFQPWPREKQDATIINHKNSNNRADVCYTFLNSTNLSEESKILLMRLDEMERKKRFSCFNGFVAQQPRITTS